MNPVVKIRVMNGNTEEACFTFDSPTICKVGRERDCEIRFAEVKENGDVSRIHCIFQINPPLIFVVDQESTNGTFVNGHKITSKVKLKSGDQVKVGLAVMNICISDLETEQAIDVTDLELQQERSD